MKGNSLVFLSTQVAFGFKKPVMGPEGLFVDLNKLSQGLFGESPNINPVPFIGNDQRLLEAHVVEAVSTDGQYDLKIARGRIDLFRNAINEEFGYSETHSDLIQKAKLILDSLEGKTSVEWFGFLNNYILEGDITDKPDKLFNDSLVNLNKGETNSFFMQHANRFDIHGTLSNSQLSVGAGEAQKNGSEKMKGLIITQDFNSKPSRKEINNDFVEAYVNEAKELIKINEIVRLLS
jgi:hypothetical protein